MTFDDDAMVFNMLTGRPKRVFCKAVDLEWPPPLLVNFMGFPFRRISMSELTDEQRKEMTHVFRGAVYEAIEAESLSEPG